MELEAEGIPPKRETSNISHTCQHRTKRRYIGKDYGVKSPSTRKT